MFDLCFKDFCSYQILAMFFKKIFVHGIDVQLNLYDQ